ncbi:MAG: acyl-phosphate glycerol 3-phosphate acyltransferase, partial [Candidatus Omnitrophica bacterium CG12_big_fil_rev_8_21_14_0_65_50_5]
LPTLMSFAVFAVVFSLSRIISISSLSAAASFPVMIAVSRRAVPEFKGLLAVSVLLACFIIYTHRANIGRLLRGEEKRLF